MTSISFLYTHSNNQTFSWKLQKRPRPLFPRRVHFNVATRIQHWKRSLTIEVEGDRTAAEAASEATEAISDLAAEAVAVAGQLQLFLHTQLIIMYKSSSIRTQVHRLAIFRIRDRGIHFNRTESMNPLPEVLQHRVTQYTI